MFVVGVRARRDIDWTSRRHRDWMLDLRPHALNWEDSSPFNPSIEQVRAKTDKILMGGVDRNSDFYGSSRDKVKAVLKMKTKEAVRQGGNKLVVWHEVMEELAQK